MTSVLAAVFLTSVKIVDGLQTGNLGILAEAAYSGLDLVAADVTYSLSDYPADQPTQNTLTVTARYETPAALQS